MDIQSKMFKEARALYFENEEPVLMTDDWKEVALDMSWEDACDEWEKEKHGKSLQ